MASNIQTLPTLYKKTNNGKVRRWNIQIVHDNEQYKILTTFGDIVMTNDCDLKNCLENKKQTHTRIIEKGKSNRTILQQAILEANSKWNEKKNQEIYVEAIDLSGNTQNSFRPMLAKTFDETLYVKGNKSRSFKFSFPVLVQRKYDGIRCFSSKDQYNNIIMNSRKGLKIENFDEIKTELRNLYSDELCNGNIIFDGELYSNSLTFESISGIVRTTDNQTENKKIIEYHIYDAYDPTNLSWVNSKRNDFINKILKTKSFTKIKFVESFKAENINEIDDFHQQFVDEGFEGIMIRQIDGIYEENKRSKYLQKYKKFMEEEFEIINFHDGEGHDKNMVIWECKTGTGKKFSVKPRGTFEDRRQMFIDASTQIGRYLTVIFQEYSADGIPRFPVGKSIRDMSY